MNKPCQAEETLKKANDKIESMRHDMQILKQEKANVEGQLKQLQAMLSSSKLR